MAKRKHVAEQSVELTTVEDAGPPAYAGAGSSAASASAAAVLEAPMDGQPAKQWRVDPFTIKTANPGGQKIQLQESRKSDAGWQMQIKFGSGSKEEMPSDAILDFIKSHTVSIPTRDGYHKDVQMFYWSDMDRAWGMRIDFDAPAWRWHARDYKV